MATVVDAARDAPVQIAHATADGFVGTARDADFDQPFDIAQSVAETHVGFAYETGVDNTADANAPQVDYETEPFWLASTPNTDRP